MADSLVDDSSLFELSMLELILLSAPPAVAFASGFGASRARWCRCRASLAARRAAWLELIVLDGQVLGEADDGRIKGERHTLFPRENGAILKGEGEGVST